MTTFSSTTNWLNEARALGRLAGPLIINNLSIAGMQFADAVMAGRLGAEALAAVAVGASVWFLGFTVCLGLMMAISPITARRFGAGELSAIGRYTRENRPASAVMVMAIGIPSFTISLRIGTRSAITMWLIMFVLGSIVYFHPIYAPP